MDLWDGFIQNQALILRVKIYQARARASLVVTKLVVYSWRCFLVTDSRVGSLACNALFLHFVTVFEFINTEPVHFQFTRTPTRLSISAVCRRLPQK
jgi:hypothetical protein